MAEDEDAVALGRARGIDVGADAEDVRPLLGCHCIVEDHAERRPYGQRPQQELEQQAAQLVGAPSSAGKEAVIRLVVTPARDASDDERLGDGVCPARTHPAREDYEQVCEPRRGQCGTKHFQQIDECAKNVVGHLDRREPTEAAWQKLAQLATRQ